MKLLRHSKIREIVETQEIETQEISIQANLLFITNVEKSVV